MSQRFLVSISVLVVVACAGPETTPTTIAPTTVAPSTTVAVTATTADVATTTMPTTTTTTTVEGEWTEVPVVASAWGVMGWWDGTVWVDAIDEPDVDLVGDYRMLGVGYEEVAEAVEVGEYCEVEAGGVVPRPELPWGEEFPIPDPAIALSAGWDLGPSVEVLDGGADPYVAVVSEFLADRGLEVESPNLAQVLRVDLDSDGVDEVIVVAEEIAQSPSLFASEGDYAVTLLRSVDGDEVVTHVLDEWVIAEVDFPDEVPFIVSSRVVAVADLNGDGSSEVALAGAYYEGSGIQVYDFDASSGPTAVLGVGCGV